MDPEEATYREGLSRNWALRHGQRPDSLSRLSAIADGAFLIAGAAALALYWSTFAPHRVLDAVVGAAIAGLVASHAMNAYFRKLEKLAFAELEGEAAGTVARRGSSSPLYPFAKIATLPRARAKAAWVEQRTQIFLKRRAAKQRQADIFEKQTIKLGSIHGTTESMPRETRT